MQLKINVKNVSISLAGLFFIWLLYALWRTKDGNAADAMTINLRELIDYSILAVERGGFAVEKIFREKNSLVSSKGKTKEGVDEFLTKADVVSAHLIFGTLDRLPGVGKKLILEEDIHENQVSDLDNYKLSNYDLWLSNQKLLSDVPSRNVPLASVTVWADPLDATKEFTESLTEFVSVMICIAIDGKPVFGVIHRPFTGETVWGLVDYGVRPKSSSATASADIVLVSRSHAGKVRRLIEDAYEISNASDPHAKLTVQAAGGSGYKTLRVVNGTAKAYIHSTNIKKWDLCAPDALIRAAGGHLTNLDGEDLTYFAPADVISSKGVLVTKTEHFQMLSKLRRWRQYV